MCTGFCSPSNGFEVVVVCSGASPQILESEEEEKMPKIDTLDALEEHEEHEDDHQTNSN